MKDTLLAPDGGDVAVARRSAGCPHRGGVPPPFFLVNRKSISAEFGPTTVDYIIGGIDFLIGIDEKRTCGVIYIYKLCQNLSIGFICTDWRWLVKNVLSSRHEVTSSPTNNDNENKIFFICSYNSPFGSWERVKL